MGYRQPEPVHPPFPVNLYDPAVIESDRACYGECLAEVGKAIVEAGLDPGGYLVALIKAKSDLCREHGFATSEELREWEQRESDRLATYLAELEKTARSRKRENR